MIHIDRDRLGDDGQPIRPPEAWFKRAAQAEALAILEGADHVTRDDVYGDPMSRAALHHLFHRKCAYCEVSIPNRTGWNIDHFRPKGRIAERPDDHPGYYWLTYRWANLYPACEDCNKRLYDTPTFTEPTEGPAAGKLDQFPLADEATRAMSHLDDLAREQRLLLDPCSDQPEDHLRFDVEGEILAHPGDPAAEATIRVLNLRRKRLRDNRRKQLDAFLALSRFLRGATASRDASLENGLREIVAKYYLADSAEHAAVARCVERDPEAFGL